MLSGISESAGNSVSELLTNQLSYWVSQVDNNLEIDLDLSGLSQQALNDLQLRLSYTFMKGRLRVSRAGGFTNVENETDISSVLGDLSIEYLLTPEGHIRAKVYRRNNPNALQTNIDNSLTGVSLLHTRSFNSLKQLFKKKRKRQPLVATEPDAPAEAPTPPESR
jgi:hypothetical protein